MNYPVSGQDIIKTLHSNMQTSTRCNEPTWPADLLLDWAVVYVHTVNHVKKGSTTSSSNKWTKNLYGLFTSYCSFFATVLNIFLKEFVSNNTRCQKQILEFIWNIWKYWWTDDEILPVFTQFIWTSKLKNKSGTRVKWNYSISYRIWS